MWYDCFLKIFLQICRWWRILFALVWWDFARTWICMFVILPTKRFRLSIMSWCQVREVWIISFRIYSYNFVETYKFLVSYQHFHEGFKWQVQYIMLRNIWQTVWLLNRGALSSILPTSLFTTSLSPPIPQTNVFISSYRREH